MRLMLLMMSDYLRSDFRVLLRSGGGAGRPEFRLRSFTNVSPARAGIREHGGLRTFRLRSFTRIV